MKQQIIAIWTPIKRFIERVILSIGALLLAAWCAALGYVWGVEAWDMGDPPKSVLAVLAFAVSAFFLSRIPSPWRKRNPPERHTASSSDSTA